MVKCITVMVRRSLVSYRTVRFKISLNRTVTFKKERDMKSVITLEEALKITHEDIMEHPISKKNLERYYRGEVPCFQPFLPAVIHPYPIKGDPK